jgi:hypothetical protein
MFAYLHVCIPLTLCVYQRVCSNVCVRVSSVKLAYCVVQFMEKDATVTEYVSPLYYHTHRQSPRALSPS